MAGISDASAAANQTDFISQLPDELLRRVLSELPPKSQAIAKRTCRKLRDVIDDISPDLTLDYSKAIDGDTVIANLIRTKRDRLILKPSQHKPLTAALRELAEQMVQFTTIHHLEVHVMHDPDEDDQAVRMHFAPGDGAGLPILIETNALSEIAELFPNLTTLKIHGDSSTEICNAIATHLPDLTHLAFTDLDQDHITHDFITKMWCLETISSTGCFAVSKNILSLFQASHTLINIGWGRAVFDHSLDNLAYLTQNRDDLSTLMLLCVDTVETAELAKLQMINWKKLPNMLQINFSDELLKAIAQDPSILTYFPQHFTEIDVTCDMDMLLPALSSLISHFVNLRIFYHIDPTFLTADLQQMLDDAKVTLIDRP